MSSNQEFEENSKRLGIEQKDFVVEDDDPPPTQPKPKLKIKQYLDRIGEIVELCDHHTAVQTIKREFTDFPVSLLVDMVRTLQDNSLVLEAQKKKIKEQRDLIRSWKRAHKKQKAKTRKLEVKMQQSKVSGYFSM